MKKLLGVLLFASVSCYAAFDVNAVLEKAQKLQAENKLPVIRSNNVLIPQGLLLENLQKKINNEKYLVEDLQLTRDKGELTVVMRDKVDVRYILDFHFTEVDWSRKMIGMDYTLRSEAASTYWIGRVLGNLAISIFQIAAGESKLNAKLAGQAYLETSPGHLNIFLDKIPDLQKALAREYNGIRLFDVMGIRSLNTEDGALRVRFFLQ